MDLLIKLNFLKNMHIILECKIQKIKVFPKIIIVIIIFIYKNFTIYMQYENFQDLKLF